MSKEIKKLGEAELEIMLIIWRAEKPLSSREILRQMEREWPLSTLMTVLERLSEKGFVHCDRSTRRNYYTALISVEQYKDVENSTFLSRLYNNSLTGFVACLYDRHTVSSEELNKLRVWLEEMEGRDGHD